MVQWCEVDLVLISPRKTINLPLVLTFDPFCMQSRHIFGAVKMRTFDVFDKSRSAMLDYGQQFQGKTYAQGTICTCFWEQHRRQISRRKAGSIKHVMKSNHPNHVFVIA